MLRLAAPSDNISGVYTEISRERERERAREGGREKDRDKSTCAHLAFDKPNQKISKMPFEASRNKSPILFCAAMGLAPPCRWTDLAQSPASKTVKTVPIARPETGNDENTLYQRAWDGHCANCLFVHYFHSCPDVSGCVALQKSVKGQHASLQASGDLGPLPCNQRGIITSDHRRLPTEGSQKALQRIYSIGK